VQKVNNTISIQNIDVRDLMLTDNYDVIAKTAEINKISLVRKRLSNVSIALRMHAWSRGSRYPQAARFLQNVFVTITWHVALPHYRELITQTHKKARFSRQLGLNSQESKRMKRN